MFKTMKLLTKDLKIRFARVGCQEEQVDPLVIAKFFDPTGGATWYATEYYPAERLFFGYISLFGDWNDEWGYFSLDELERYQGPLGIGIERDLYFEERPISKIDPRAIEHRLNAEG